jgi:hypothetical protein
MKEMLDASDREKADILQRHRVYARRGYQIYQSLAEISTTGLYNSKKERLKPNKERKLTESYFAWKPQKNKTRRRIGIPRSPAENHPD